MRRRISRHTDTQADRHRHTDTDTDTHKHTQTDMTHRQNHTDLHTHTQELVVGEQMSRPELDPLEN